jgi:predicted Kef-type K+ transport protein
MAEFSMILAGKGYVAGLISRPNYLLFLTVTVFSLLFNPLLFKWAMSFSFIQNQRMGKVISMSASSAKLSHLPVV